MNPQLSADGFGPARGGYARRSDLSEGDRAYGSNAPTLPRRQPVVDLFQPVTSSEPPAAATTNELVTPLNRLNLDGEVRTAPAPSRNAPGTRRWAGLVTGTPGAMIALVASAALVIVAWTSLSTTSSSTESPVATAIPGQVPAPAIPAISDEPLVTVPPIDVPAGLTPQTPAMAYSSDSPPEPARQQVSPIAQRTLATRPASLPAPDHGPVLPSPSPPPPSSPPSSPPSTVTTEDAEYWTFPTGSDPENTEPCDCDDRMRKIPNRGNRPSMADWQREYQARRAAHRPTSPAQESRPSEEDKHGEQPTRPNTPAGPRPSPHQRPATGEPYVAR